MKKWFKEWFEEEFEQWETIKRNKMGDKAFLKKYIKYFPRLDTIQKIFLPIAIAVLPVNIFGLAIEGKYKYMAVQIGFILYLIFYLWSHYSYRFDLHKQKVEEWKKELEELNKNALCASVPLCEKKT